MEPKRTVTVNLVITREELTSLLRRKKILRPDETVNYLKIREGDLLVTATSQEKKPAPQKKSSSKILKKDIPVNLLNATIEDMELGMRTHNVLISAKITTLADLLQFSKNDLFKFRKFGPKSYTDLIAAIRTLQKKHNFTKFDLVPGILSSDSGK